MSKQYYYNNEGEVTAVKKNKKNSEIKGKFNLKILIMAIIAFLCLFGGIVSVKNGLGNKSEYSTIFNEKGNIDYNVYLKNNDKFDSPFLNKGMSYVANLIDFVKVKFDYNLNSSKTSSLKYKYDVNAKLVITERGADNKVLFTKNYELMKQKEETANTSGTILHEVDIDYGKYNAFVNEFKKDYSLTVSSKLVVSMHIEATGKSDVVSKTFNSMKDLTLTIPLSEQTLEITLDSNNISNSQAFIEYGKLETKNIIFLAAGGVLIILALVLCIMLISKFLGKKKSDTKYERDRNNILREYDRVIVETNTIENNSKYDNVIYVKTFNELLDARDNVENPILFHENIERTVSTFMVIDQNVLYIYRINEEGAQNEKA